MNEHPRPTDRAEWLGWLSDALAPWLPEQRWFAGKGREIASVEVIQELGVSLFPWPDYDLAHAIAEVSYLDSGENERYQIFLGYARELPEKLEHVKVGVLPDGWIVYDALWDDAFAHYLVQAMGLPLTVADGALAFAAEPGAELPDADHLPSRVIDSEQSNTSVVYDETAILKVFRRVQPGRNPDLEINRALSAAENPHVARLLGAIEGVLDGEPVSYAMLSAYADNSADGWSMATASVRDLMAEQDLRADEVGGDFAAESHRLGEAVAEVHADLARQCGTGTLGADGLASLAAQMRTRLESAIRVVPELEPYENALLEAYAAVSEVVAPVPTQRIHGDLHLGQVLRTPITWLLIDFEGEPIKPMSERVRPDSPLRDVAGMLRSYDYAAGHLLLAEEQAAHPDDHDRQLQFRTQEWITRNRDAFCAGYANAAGADPRDEATLLRAYELDKAVYETVYESRNRPQWLPIPLRSLATALT
ncbi:MAG: maltokinase N-terminal cap-like domain-containing protein [Micromonosporaceae bacterium]